MKPECNSLPSALVGRLRDRLKPHVHGGIMLDSEQVVALIGNLNTIEALAKETEEELEIADRGYRTIQRIPIHDTGKIVRIGVRPKLSLVTTDGTRSE